MTAAAAAGSPPRARTGAGRMAWPAAVAGTLLLGIASGGSSQADSVAFLTFRLLCAVLLGLALLRLLSAPVTLAGRVALVIAFLAVGLTGLHLVPLPYGVFTGLPGRDFVATAFNVAGVPAQWMPLTLSPEATWACILALLPPLAIFLAALASGARAHWLMAGAVLLGVIASVMLGLAQRFQGPKSSLYLYEIANFGSATGFFSNRNNFAMLLAVAIPLTWAVIHKIMRRGGGNALIVLAGGAAMMGIILLGLAVSTSRSGILLGMLALALSTVMVWSPGRQSRRSSRARISLLALLGGALIIGQFGMLGILRIAETDPLTEYRNQIAQVTIRTAATYFPVGSGFGTFGAVYGMHETPATMVSAYINHAHNDWLELWLEGGLPAAVLMAAFLVLFLGQAVRVWNPQGAYAAHVLPRAASIGVLVLLLHSLVEFPLRMPALASVFALLMAFMLAPAATSHHPSSGRSRGRADDAPLPAPEKLAVASTPPIFKVANSEVGSPAHSGLEEKARRR